MHEMRLLMIRRAFCILTEILFTSAVVKNLEDIPTRNAYACRKEETHSMG